MAEITNAQKKPVDNSNYGGKNKGRKFIILHANGGSAEGTAAWLNNPESNVSYHYLVTKEGDVWQFVDDQKRAWHAGVSRWENFTDLNDWSIGVALESDEGKHNDITDIQLSVALTLVGDLIATYDISPSHVLGHKEVSPDRKVDPIHVNMDSFRDRLTEQLGHVFTVKTLVFHGLEPHIVKAINRGTFKVRHRGNKLDIKKLDE